MKNSLARRHFLATASAAALCLPTLPSVSAAAPQDRRLQLGIQLYSLRGYALQPALEHAAQIGFSQVEFYGGMLPIEATPGQIAEVKQQVADLGLTISAHGVNRFGSDKKANEDLFKFAQQLGIKTLTADPDPESFDQLDELVQEYDIRVAIHNHGPRHRYNKVVDVLRAVEKRDPRIGACADLGHFIRSGENATEVIRLLQGRLYGIHLKDFAEMKDKTEGVILGKGHLDVEGVIDALIAVDFPSDGALSLEYEENPENPIADITACFQIANAAIQRVNQAR
ncbi:MAG: sugar phosphate isomerase/epimerase [Planctomycetales bacterium]|nr:sugar phosphate isomerase/epimerase [Planctomycetales bacterium]